MYKRVQGTKFNVNPLSFYDGHKSKFSWISALSLRWVCVPPISVPFERIVSFAGHIISQEHVRLEPEKADMLIFWHKNADWLTERLKYQFVYMFVVSLMTLNFIFYICKHCFYHHLPSFVRQPKLVVTCELVINFVSSQISLRINLFVCWCFIKRFKHKHSL